MPNILSVSNEEITWQLSGSHINPGAQANARIKEYLGEEAKYFAPMSATTMGYTWTSNETGWSPLAVATDEQKQRIETELQALRARIVATLSNTKLAQEIIKLPTDYAKYVFFIDDGLNFRILIAGWGFSNARRKVIIPGRVTHDKQPLADVKVGFLIDGELQPLHKFNIVTVSGNLKQQETETAGFYAFGELKVGTQIHLQDISSGKDISFVVEENKNEYIFDVTRYTRIVVSVTKDGLPQENTSIRILSHGKASTIVTDAQGKSSVEIPYFEGETIEATFDNNSKVVQSAYPEVVVDFQIESEIVTPPAIETSNLSITCITSDGKVKSNYPLMVTIAGIPNCLTTDMLGQIVLPDLFVGSLVEVNDGLKNATPLCHKIIAGKNELIYVVQGEEINNLQIIGFDGLPVRNQDVILTQGSKSMTLPLDDNGMTHFGSEEFEPNKGITVQIRLGDSDFDSERITFITEPDERDYQIQANLAVKKAWWRIALNILLILLLIYAMASLGEFIVQYLPLI